MITKRRRRRRSTATVADVRHPLTCGAEQKAADGRKSISYRSVDALNASDRQLEAVSQNEEVGLSLEELQVGQSLLVDIIKPAAFDDDEVQRDKESLNSLVQIAKMSKYV